jgi:hypothetical protein
MKTVLSILAASAWFSCPGCMSQQTATRQNTHEFIEELPNHPKTEVYDRVVEWVANTLKPEHAEGRYQNREAGSIVLNGNADITPDGAWINLKIGFTMNVDVRNEKIRVRFTNLRRLYGSKKYEEPSRDDFFATSTALPYQQTAHQRFAVLVQDLTAYIEQGKGAPEVGNLQLSTR